MQTFWSLKRTQFDLTFGLPKSEVLKVFIYDPYPLEKSGAHFDKSNGVWYSLLMDYEQIRDKCIKTFGKLYKDTPVFDYCEVDKQTRLRLQQDPVYIAKTKALKARLFLDQLDTLDNVLAGSYQGEKPTDMSSTVLKA
jgi:hypothetical protein